MSPLPCPALPRCAVLCCGVCCVVLCPQARAVIDGLPADVVALALPLDVQKIADAGLLREDWRKRFPLQSVGALGRFCTWAWDWFEPMVSHERGSLWAGRGWSLDGKHQSLSLCRHF